MTYTYTLIDGQRVEASTVAPNFEAMAAEFQRVWGLTLHVKSGTRTWQEQYDLWVGWTKRLPGYNLALHPDNPLAYHVETNPMGSRALDLYDSGADAGVTVVGSRRNNWIRDNCPRWGFTLSGLTFTPKEGWHIHYTGTIGGTAGGSTGFPAKDRYGSTWVSAGQEKLKQLGLYSGAIDGLDGGLTQLGVKQLQEIGGLEQDGIYGPKTNELADLILAGKIVVSRPVADVQRVIGATADGVFGPLSKLALYKWQKANGLTPDAIYGPASDAKAFPTTSVPTPPDPAPSVPGADEASVTPNLITPTAADFPSWIKFDIAYDPDGQAPDCNLSAYKYYGVLYSPIEGHAHWWGEPGNAGTHDSNVKHLQDTPQLSTNFVTSAGRVTLMVPLHKLASTTGRRNPYGWKCENDPALTALGYLTIGYLFYIVEKLNPSLKGEAVRLHKEFMQTSCSAIDPKRVRDIADAFANGTLDPATGQPPVVVTPPPVVVPPALPSLDDLTEWLKAVDTVKSGIEKYVP